MAHAPLSTAGGGAPLPDRARQQRRLIDLALGAAWLVGLAAALQIVTLLLSSSPLAAALAGAVVADLVAVRAGVQWIDPLEREAPDRRARLARRAGLGAALGAFAVLLPLGASLAIGWATVEPGAPSLSFAFALVRAVALAVRDELLLSGIPLATAARAGLSSRWAVAFSALAHGAALGLAPGATASSVALATALGALAAALFRHGRGAIAAVAAHASFTALAGAGLRGSLLDVTWIDGALAAGTRAFGPPAWLAAAVLALLAALVLRAGAPRPGRPAP
ncbi:type II CAAX prenyl endopeptidase Rce1 family protein [Sorangium sp. So ce1335]|uniref:type II CAAX prenyl endopeptidase Rce1 family protein n=1 Tax=Sorangium sp. So ce1335 TaxID=3133335 RepID=UPI003F6040F4